MYPIVFKFKQPDLYNQYINKNNCIYYYYISNKVVEYTRIIILRKTIRNNYVLMSYKYTKSKKKTLTCNHLNLTC